jgi:hypothetical protein
VYRAATTLLPPHQRVQLTPLTEALVSDYAVSIARCISYGHNLKVCRTEGNWNSIQLLTLALSSSCLTSQ